MIALVNTKDFSVKSKKIFLVFTEKITFECNKRYSLNVTKKLFGAIPKTDFLELKQNFFVLTGNFFECVGVVGVMQDDAAQSAFRFGR